MNYRKTNVFPIPIYEIDCMDLVDDTIDVLQKTVFPKETPYVSENFYSLNKFPFLVKKFEEKVNDALSEHQYVVPFRMTTSWFTCTIPGNVIRPHKHINCLWSASFYFFDNCSPINFIKDKSQIYAPFNCSDPTIMTSGTVKFPSQKGVLILFPSHIEHNVDQNNTNVNRYSLAMNFMPDGMCSWYDSEYNYKHDPL